MNSSAELQEGIRKVLLRELGKEARAFEKLKGGRNSQVFRVDCSDGERFAVKAYFQSPEDRRDRIGNEFRALRFLADQGLRQVPRALAADETLRVGVYEFIQGEPLKAGSATEREIDQAVEFLRALRSFKSAAAPAHFPAASEACFSIEAVLRNLEGRFNRLIEASDSQPELAEFLRDTLLPFRSAAEEWSRAYCGRHGIDPETEIALEDRTLSPSDFGFHNALRRAGGSLVFVDFEYFGWDDPAKTIADFLLHPAMELSPALKQRFFSGALAAFAGARGLERRVHAVYPLFGLKWCAILLNEFTLEHMRRRCFADNAPGAWSGAAQIQKAQQMLAGVLHDYREFPFHA